VSKTSIEWTDAVWNPVRGCTKVSPGCAHCYAETFAERWRGVPGHPYEQGFDLRLVPEKLAEPLTWKKPRRVFVNSMSDLFHESVPDEYIDLVFAIMALTPQHTYQVLTKRSERMRRWATAPGTEERGEACADGIIGLLGVESGVDACERIIASAFWREPLPNVWLGVSVENQKAADERIPDLVSTPAAVRFISAEPLLGPIEFRPSWVAGYDYDGAGCSMRSKPRIDWVIAGGESGPTARPMHPDWARSLRDQCSAAEVPFFFKQWGEWAPGECVERTRGRIDVATWFDSSWLLEEASLSCHEGHYDDQPDVYRVGKKAAGRILDGREWNEFPEVRA